MTLSTLVSCSPRASAMSRSVRAKKPGNRARVSLSVLPPPPFPLLLANLGLTVAGHTTHQLVAGACLDDVVRNLAERHLDPRLDPRKRKYFRGFLSSTGEQGLLQLRRPRAFAQSIPGSDHRKLGAHSGVGAIHCRCLALHRQGGKQHPPPSCPVLRCSAPSACPH